MKNTKCQEKFLTEGIIDFWQKICHTFEKIITEVYAYEAV